MELVFENHPSDDSIELYALGRLAEELVPSVEEHLLLCEQCRNALHDEDSFAKSVVAVLKPKRGKCRSRSF
jgi:anti-sigma factor ChrR (cupin superfamily)